MIERADTQSTDAIVVGEQYIHSLWAQELRLPPLEEYVNHFGQTSFSPKNRGLSKALAILWEVFLFFFGPI